MASDLAYNSFAIFFSIYREVKEIKVILYNIKLSYGLHIQSISHFLA